VQYPDDGLLADAINAALRNLKLRLRFGWGGDATFAHPYSDMSSVIERIETDRPISGDFPTELSVLEGYSTGKMVIRLSGTRNGDELDVVRLFSPYQQNSPMYTVVTQNAVVELDVVVKTPSGDRVIRQFTGRIEELNPKLSEGIVEVICYDTTTECQREISPPIWAIDGYDREQNGFGKYPINATWLIDFVLRQCGFYSGPATTPYTKYFTTGNGGFLPEVGILSEGAGFIIGDYVSPRWIPGKYGYAINYSTPPGTVTTDTVGAFSAVGGGYANWRPVNEGTDANPTCLGPSAWVLLDPALDDSTHFFYSEYWIGDINNPTIITEARAYFYVTTDGFVQFSLLHEDGSWTKQWTYQIPGVVKDWYHVAAAACLGNTTVTFKLFVNGTDVSGSVTLVGGGSSGPYPTMLPAGNIPRDWGNFIAWRGFMPFQYHAWVQKEQSTITIADFPKDPPTTGRRSVIDLGLNELTHIKDHYQVDGWALLKDIVAAELGTIYADEYGTIYFKNHISVRRLSSYTENLTVDNVDDLEMRTSTRGVRNLVNFTAQSAAAWYTVAWALSDVRLYDSEVGVTYIRTEELDNVMCLDRRFPLPHLGESGAPPIPDRFDSNVTHGLVCSGLLIAYLNSAGDLDLPPGDTLPGPNWNLFAHSLEGPQERAIRSFVTARSVISPANVPGRFSLPDGRTPAIHIGGWKLKDDAPLSGTIENTGSQALYSKRSIELATSEWRQDFTSVQAVAAQLLHDTANPIPMFENIGVRGDPRRQLLDSHIIADPKNIGSRLLVTVMGIRRILIPDEPLRDFLTLRLRHPPGSWVLGDPVYGVLGSTTRLVP